MQLTTWCKSLTRRIHQEKTAVVVILLLLLLLLLFMWWWWWCSTVCLQCWKGQYCLIYVQGLPVSEVLVRLCTAPISNFIGNFKKAAGSSYRLFSHQVTITFVQVDVQILFNIQFPSFFSSCMCISDTSVCVCVCVCVCGGGGVIKWHEN
jgi:hypothetical protein